MNIYPVKSIHTQTQILIQLLKFLTSPSSCLQVVIFTSYSIKNDTDFQIFVLETKRSPLSR